MALADIETIVVLILENRSFDHMLGYLSLPATPQPMSVEGLESDTAWLAARANECPGHAPIPSYGLQPGVQTIDDPAHDHRAISAQINTPPSDASLKLMGGFVDSYVRFSATPPTDPSLVMGHYDQQSVPIFDFLAHEYAVCDHWFAALPAGTQPNRLMAMAGETTIVDNSTLLLPDQYLVYDWLTDHKVNWCTYQWGGFFPFFSLNGRLLPEIVTSLTLSELGGKGRFRRYSKFAEHWASKDPMPSVIFIEPEYKDGPSKDPNDDHPPVGIAKGQALVADIYQTLIGNLERWAKTMFVIFYDEHGGFYDHVPPLPIPTNVGTYQFQTTGVRVPALVVSPQVTRGRVFNRNLDHTSMLQLLDDKFSPGHGYSVPVNARQSQLDRLANVLDPNPTAVRAPPIPKAILDAVIQTATAAPASPTPTVTASDPPNAQALHRVALTVKDQHPDLLAQQGWEDVRNYLAKT